MLMASDGRAMTATGAFHSDSTSKLVVTGRRSAAALGGYCEVIVKEGPRAGNHWRLSDSLGAVRHFPPSSATDRANHLFDAAYRAAAEWFSHDTDAAEPGVDRRTTVLYAEVSR